MNLKCLIFSSLKITTVFQNCNWEFGKVLNYRIVIEKIAKVNYILDVQFEESIVGSKNVNQMYILNFCNALHFCFIINDFYLKI